MTTLGFACFNTEVGEEGVNMTYCLSLVLNIGIIEEDGGIGRLPFLNLGDLRA